MLKFNRLILSLPLLLAATSLAQARQNPTPPPSGIVVHLFGPDSVINNVLPSELDGKNSSQDSATPNAAAGSQNSGYVEPSMHDVLHQLFVTGDPNRPTLPSAGRTGERP